MDSEIEITIDIDASRTAKTTAFIPILDEQFEGVFHAELTAKTAADLQRELDQELDRLEKLRQQSAAVGDARAQIALENLDAEELVETTRRQVATAQGDPDARTDGEMKLLRMKAALDVVEAAIEWPALLQQGYEVLSRAEEAIDQHGTPEEKRQFETLRADFEHAVA
jgi:molecular chaperone DnaK